MIERANSLNIEMNFDCGSMSESRRGPVGVCSEGEVMMIGCCWGFVFGVVLDGVVVETVEAEEEVVVLVVVKRRRMVVVVNVERFILDFDLL